VFDGLFPDAHNKIVIRLLFIMSHWHGLAKLRMHSDLTLNILDETTTDLGKQFRLFKESVCASYQTQELDREVDARSRRQAKEEAKRAKNSEGKGKEKAGASSEQSHGVHRPRQPRKKKSFNIQTYKFHVLGDYVASIRHFGTTDSYSTEPVSFKLPFICSLTQFASGRAGAPYTERQVPSHGQKKIHSPIDSDRAPGGSLAPYEATAIPARPFCRGK
jgi:hypothetical protein